jgi:two-component sensor histidine kinase
LNGEWAFTVLIPDPAAPHGGAYRRVPDQWHGRDAGADWGMGYASYRLRVLLPVDCGPLAIRNFTIATAFRLFVNGKLIGSAGRPGPSPAESRAAYGPGLASLGEVGNEIEIDVRVSNWEYRSGGIWRSLSLGPEARLAKQKRDSNIIELVLCASLMTLSANILINYLMRRKDRSHLYFHGFAAIVSMRTLFTGEYLAYSIFPNISFEILIKLEYLSIITCPPLFLLFYSHFYPFAVPRRLRDGLVLAWVPLLLSLPFLPLPAMTRMTPLYYCVILFQVFVMLYLHFTKAKRFDRMESTVIAIGGIVLFLTLLNDIFLNSVLLVSFNMLPLGLAFFVVMLTAMLARRSNAAFDRAELLADDLGRANSLLHARLRENQETRERLEVLLSEKELLIKEIHHRVKNSLQVVSSIISLQASRAPGPMEREQLAALRMRIRSISLVHEKLYGSVSSEKVDLVSYLRELTSLHQASYGSQSRPIGFESDRPEYTAGIELCVDAGLILTELLSNAFKHGTASAEKTGGMAALVRIECGQEALRLEVRDFGPGPPEGFDPARSTGLGLTMARTLAQRWGGSVEMEQASPEGGTLARVSFKLEGHQS